MQNRLNRPPGKVAIIGGGVAGLAAGSLLARNGVAVKLFEANDKLGGCCATTTVDGFTFNDGAVYLAVVNILDRAFATLGLSRAELLPLRKITANFCARLLDGTVVTLREGLDLSVEGRAIDQGRLQDELRRMLDKWVPVLRLFSEHVVTHPFSPYRLLRHGWRQLHKFRGTVAAELSRSISDEAARAALSGTMLYSGLPPDRAPVSTILGLITMMTEGFFLPAGGMGTVPQVLGCALRKQGGEIFLNAAIDRIIIDGGRVRGVDIKGQGRVDADAIISTSSAMSTFASLVGAQHVPPAMKRKLRRTRLSHRAVSLQFGLANAVPAPAHLNMLLPPMERQGVVFAQDPRQVTLPVYYVPTRTMPELAPAGGSIIEMFHPIAPGVPLEYWDESKKKQLAESAISALRRMYDLKIVAARVRSPKDFQEGMHLFDGALYGLSPAASPLEQFPHKTAIPGLFLAGQSTYPGYGVGASMMSGIFAADKLMRSGLARSPAG